MAMHSPRICSFYPHRVLRDEHEERRGDRLPPSAIRVAAEDRVQVKRSAVGRRVLQEDVGADDVSSPPIRGGS